MLEVMNRKIKLLWHYSILAKMRSKAVASVNILCILFIHYVNMSMSSLLENGVFGEPRVDCGVESISVWVRTQHHFHGRLYVEEESEHEECLKSYAPGSHEGYSSKDLLLAEFNIRFGQCNMRRQRILNPRGVSYSFTLVVSFHPIFLTGVDKAFNIKCFFLEAVKAVDIALDVSPLTTIAIEREFALPQCTYHLKQAPDGPFLKFANIGEPITHVWQCDPAGWIYDVLIHSCYVDDGRGNRFDLIDDKGCAIDRYLLDDIVYDEKGLGAFVNTHVFRYADRIQLFFTCTLQLCFKEDGGCRGITPPSCSSIESGQKVPTSNIHLTNVGRKDFSPPPHVSVPPGLAAPRELLRKLNRQTFRPRVPSFLTDRKVPHGTRRTSPDFHESLLFGNPYKDSPIGNETDNLRINDFNNETVRASRDTTIGNMETDLSADLTVLPLHETFSLNDPDSLNKKTFMENKEKMNTSPQRNIMNSEFASEKLEFTESDLSMTSNNNTLSSEPRIASPEEKQSNLNDSECIRWKYKTVILTASALILSSTFLAIVITSLICVKKRHTSLNTFHGCEKAIRRILKERRNNEFSY